MIFFLCSASIVLRNHCVDASHCRARIVRPNVARRHARPGGARLNAALQRLVRRPLDCEGDARCEHGRAVAAGMCVKLCCYLVQLCKCII